MREAIFILSVCFALLRLYFVPHIAPSLPGTYTALAHLFSGFLLFGWIFPPMGYRRCLFWVPLVYLTLLEGIAFFAIK